MQGEMLRCGKIINSNKFKIKNFIFIIRTIMIELSVSEL